MLWSETINAVNLRLERAGTSPARLGCLAAVSVIVALLFLQIFHAARMLIGADANGIMPNGIALGSDFISVWSAGYLAATGQAAQAYTDAILRSVHDMAVPANTATFPWFYPPVFQLVAMPLGMLPYLVAAPLYALGLAAFYLWVLWRLRPKADTLLLGIAFQGTWLCLLAGQNGTLSAALLGLGILALRGGRPQQGGIAWGMICYKPQLAIPLGFAALVSPAGRKMIIPAVATIVALCTASVLVLGEEVWRTFLTTSGRLADILADGALPMDHMISVYAALWRSGIAPLWALAGQALVASVSIVILAILWSKPDTEASIDLKGAALVWSVLLSTPHLFQYELPLAGLGLLLMWREAERNGWYRGEKLWLFLVWMSPVLVDFALFPVLFFINMCLCAGRILRHNAQTHAGDKLCT